MINIRGIASIILVSLLLAGLLLQLAGASKHKRNSSKRRAALIRETKAQAVPAKFGQVDQLESEVRPQSKSARRRARKAAQSNAAKPHLKSAFDDESPEDLVYELKERVEEAQEKLQEVDQLLESTSANPKVTEHYQEKPVQAQVVKPTTKLDDEETVGLEGEVDPPATGELDNVKDEHHHIKHQADEQVVDGPAIGGDHSSQPAGPSVHLEQHDESSTEHPNELISGQETAFKMPTKGNDEPGAFAAPADSYVPVPDREADVEDSDDHVGPTNDTSDKGDIEDDEDDYDGADNDEDNDHHHDNDDDDDDDDDADEVDTEDDDEDDLDDDDEDDDDRFGAKVKRHSWDDDRIEDKAAGQSTSDSGSTNIIGNGRAVPRINTGSVPYQSLDPAEAARREIGQVNPANGPKTVGTGGTPVSVQSDVDGFEDKRASESTSGSEMTSGFIAKTEFPDSTVVSSGTKADKALSNVDSIDTNVKLLDVHPNNTPMGDVAEPAAAEQVVRRENEPFRASVGGIEESQLPRVVKLEGGDEDGSSDMLMATPSVARSARASASEGLLSGKMPSLSSFTGYFKRKPDVVEPEEPETSDHGKIESDDDSQSEYYSVDEGPDDSDERSNAINELDLDERKSSFSMPKLPSVSVPGLPGGFTVPDSFKKVPSIGVPSLPSGIKLPSMPEFKVPDVPDSLKKLPSISMPTLPDSAKLPELPKVDVSRLSNDLTSKLPSISAPSLSDLAKLPNSLSLPKIPSFDKPNLPNRGDVSDAQSDEPDLVERDRSEEVTRSSSPNKELPQVTEIIEPDTPVRGDSSGSSIHGGHEMPDVVSNNEGFNALDGTNQLDPWGHAEKTDGQISEVDSVSTVPDEARSALDWEAREQNKLNRLPVVPNIVNAPKEADLESESQLYNLRSRGHGASYGVAPGLSSMRAPSLSSPIEVNSRRSPVLSARPVQKLGQGFVRARAYTRDARHKLRAVDESRPAVLRRPTFVLPTVVQRPPRALDPVRAARGTHRMSRGLSRISSTDWSQRGHHHFRDSMREVRQKIRERMHDMRERLHDVREQVHDVRGRVHDVRGRVATNLHD